MLSLETRLHMNDAEVTATVIDGEAIMINLIDKPYKSHTNRLYSSRDPMYDFYGFYV